MMRYAALGLAAAGLASAQTFSVCNPVKGDTCPPNPAFGNQADYDFRTSKNIDDLESFFVVDGGVKFNSKVMSFSADTGAEMTIFEENNAPTLTSKNYLFFGKVEVELQAAPGRGIVTSIVLQSDVLDEIDWEFIGSDQTHVQTNFYALGVNDYTHGRFHPVSFNPMTSFHTYTIEWTKESIIFSIDGEVYRTATPEEGNYPQTPMQLKLGTWVGGKGTSQGTIDWAGGLAEWDNGPFAGYYRSLKVWDYAGGDKAGAELYEYSKGSDGKWQSIRVVGAGAGDKPFPGGVAYNNGGKDNRPDDKGKAAQSDGPVVSLNSTSVQTSTTNGPVSSATAITRANGTSLTLTRQASNSPTGSAYVQTTLPVASATPTPTRIATSSASRTLQSSFLVACLSGFFANILL
ncbi:glycosyl hydrolase family 16 [Colletotrichum graminicola]|uniref:Glycosyl hydrolase family 16 n=1 Tax=Colletotrichum graminicola (strain M1.001 / M2 / FGSC 10212) TaxID=645133 RepID=E3Q8T7_COLGM|nr:glycosyl hydrolase family 16 [Colletotrichum graminicola M1.001]EFQ27451.1 glycosyl hydrolase family 16 [Colletotrichum graminicola M1.001]WDK13257.1 glycosyl hydrolase family 16 [Colletotrichum graminicola]